jgi:hypothetical protein
MGEIGEGVFEGIWFMFKPNQIKFRFHSAPCFCALLTISIKKWSSEAAMGGARW